MDIVIEIILEIYLELMTLIIPKDKTTSKKYRILAILFAVIVLICVVVLFFGGLFLLDDNNYLGIVPIVFSIIISLIQIIAGIVLYFKKEDN